MSRRHARLGLALLLTACLLALAGPSPSQAGVRDLAGGSFDWTFSGKLGKNSRSWNTSRSADIWIGETVEGPSCRQYDIRFSIQLQRKSGLRWKDYANPRDVICDPDNPSNGLLWTKAPRAKYRFKIIVEPPTRGHTAISIAGTVYHSGARP